MKFSNSARIKHTLKKVDPEATILPLIHRETPIPLIESFFLTRKINAFSSDVIKRGRKI